MPLEFDPRRMDTPARVLSVCGLLGFIVTFLSWADISFMGHYVASWSAWSAGFGAWFPMLVLLAIGIAAALPGFGRRSVNDLPQWTVTGSVIALIIVLIRWVTLPTGVAADYGLYIGLVLTIVVGVVGVRSLPSDTLRRLRGRTRSRAR